MCRKFIWPKDFQSTGLPSGAQSNVRCKGFWNMVTTPSHLHEKDTQNHIGYTLKRRSLVRIASHRKSLDNAAPPYASTGSAASTISNPPID